jgi:hypothetical protein
LSNDACAVGRRAWAAYLQAAVDNNCKLSATDLANILRMSVPFATNVQKYEIEREVGEWPTEDCQQPQILLNDWVKPQKFKWQRFKFLACGAYGCSSLWQYKTSSTSRSVPTVEVRKRVLAHTSKYFKQGKIRFEDMWFETPLREFAMLQAFYKARLAVKPLDEPKRTDESREMLLIKEHVEYYSPVGEQYWTYGMQAGSMTLKQYVECGDLTSSTVDGITEQILAIFARLKAAKFTHGDFHLANLVMLNGTDGNMSLKLIDFAFSSTTLFLPWYDLVSFTTDCFAAEYPRSARTLAENVFRELAKDAIYQQTIDSELLEQLQKEKFQGSVGQLLPMVKSRAIRDVLFHNVYKKLLVSNQLQIDGSSWYRALQVKKGISAQQLASCAQTSPNFTQFKVKVLSLILSQ